MKFKTNYSIADKLFLNIKKKIQREQELFKVSMLNRMRDEVDKIEDQNGKKKFQLHSIELQEQELLIQKDHFFQMDRIFKAFHKYLRGQQLVQNQNGQNSIVFDINPQIQYDILNELQFGLEIKQSTLKNPFVKNGVFLRHKYYDKIKKGTIIGFVPGIYTEDFQYYDQDNIIRPISMSFSINKKISYPNPFISIYSDKLIYKLKRENQFRISGDQLNFLAKGHKIKHASENKSPNVMLYDIKIDTSIFPSSFFNYSPCWNIFDNQIEDFQGYILGVITLRDIEDDEELFLDYYDIYELDQNNQEKWLSVPQDQLDIYYTKKAIEYLNPTLINFIKKQVYPQQKIKQLDFSYRVQKNIEELRSQHKEQIEQLQKKVKQIEDKKQLNKIKIFILQKLDFKQQLMIEPIKNDSFLPLENAKLELPHEFVFLALLDIQNLDLIYKVHDYDNFPHISDLIEEELIEIKLEQQLKRKVENSKSKFFYDIRSIYSSYKWSLRVGRILLIEDRQENFYNRFMKLQEILLLIKSKMKSLTSQNLLQKIIKKQENSYKSIIQKIKKNKFKMKVNQKSKNKKIKKIYLNKLNLLVINLESFINQ